MKKMSTKMSGLGGGNDLASQIINRSNQPPAKGVPGIYDEPERPKGIEEMNLEFNTMEHSKQFQQEVVGHFDPFRRSMTNTGWQLSSA